MIVLSLFDGMSCGKIALDRARIKVDKYFASEIKLHAIKVSKDNYPSIIHIGDVKNLRFKDGVLYTEKGNFNVGKIDLLIGGTPCQDFSIARTMGKLPINGLQGDKSILFYEYLRILKEVNPAYFLLENTKMKMQSKLDLNKYLGVKNIIINSKTVSFQIRTRYYWTNIPDVTIPENKYISFQDFKDEDEDYISQFKLKKTPSRIRAWAGGVGRNNGAGCANVTTSDRVYCLTTKQDRTPNSGLVEYKDFCRYLTRRELEHAQTVPVDYTKSVSYNQACNLLGDGWTISVIEWIFSFLPKKYFIDSK